MSRYRTPLKNVRGLGAAKTGTEHFVIQRLTAPHWCRCRSGS